MGRAADVATSEGTPLSLSFTWRLLKRRAEPNAYLRDFLEKSLFQDLKIGLGPPALGSGI